MNEKLRRLGLLASITSGPFSEDLSLTERTVVVLRLGWDRLDQPRTQVEVAEILQVSQGYVSTLETSACRRMREAAEKIL